MNYTGLDHGIVGWNGCTTPVPDVNPPATNVPSPHDRYQLVCLCGEVIVGWNSAVCASLAKEHVRNVALREDLVALEAELR